MKRSLMVLSVIMALVPAGAASASCMMLPPLGQALSESETVFVGTVVALDNNDRNATVEVEEVWKGDVDEGLVEVHGGAQGANVASSVDRTYDLGKRYLFAVTGSASSFQDSACTATQRYREGLDRFRPLGVESSPTDGGNASPGSAASGDRDIDDDRSSVPVVPIVAAAALLSGLSFALLRKRRSTI